MKHMLFFYILYRRVFNRNHSFHTSSIFFFFIDVDGLIVESTVLHALQAARLVSTLNAGEYPDGIDPDTEVALFYEASECEEWFAQGVILLTMYIAHVF